MSSQRRSTTREDHFADDVPDLLPQERSTDAADRLRLARDVHDWVGSGLALALRQLDLHTIETAREDGTPHRRIAEVRHTLEEILDSTRRLVRDLRDGQVVPGVEAALRDSLARVEVDCGRVQVRIESSGDESVLPYAVREEVFLVLREALRNALEHARAGTITVDLGFGRDRLVASVEDDGVGHDRGDGPAGGAGLATMQERAALLGGRLSVGPGRRGGTRVELQLDLAGGRSSHGG